MRMQKEQNLLRVKFPSLLLLNESITKQKLICEMYSDEIDQYYYQYLFRDGDEEMDDFVIQNQEISENEDSQSIDKYISSEFNYNDLQKHEQSETFKDYLIPQEQQNINPQKLIYNTEEKETTTYRENTNKIQKKQHITPLHIPNSLKQQAHMSQLITNIGNTSNLQVLSPTLKRMQSTTEKTKKKNIINTFSVENSSKKSLENSQDIKKDNNQSEFNGSRSNAYVVKQNESYEQSSNQQQQLLKNNYRPINIDKNNNPNIIIDQVRQLIEQFRNSDNNNWNYPNSMNPNQNNSKQNNNNMRKNDEITENFEVMCNFEYYLPHNNLSQLVEYFKYKKRQIKQLRISWNKINNTEIKPVDFSLGILNQYPFFNSICSRDFQFLRCFEIKLHQIQEKKKMHMNRLSILSNNPLNINNEKTPMNTILKNYTSYNPTSDLKMSRFTAALKEFTVNSVIDKQHQVRDCGEDPSQLLDSKIDQNKQMKLQCIQLGSSSGRNIQFLTNKNLINNSMPLSPQMKQSYYLSSPMNSTCVTPQSQYQKYINEKKKLFQKKMVNQSILQVNSQLDRTFNKSFSIIPSQEVQDGDIMSLDEQDDFYEKQNINNFFPRQFIYNEEYLQNQLFPSSRNSIQQELKLNNIKTK